VPKAKIHIRRIQNITSRYTKHKVYIDGFMVGSLKCGEAKWFDINDEGIMHRLAFLAGIKNTQEAYLDRQQWNHSSFDEGVDQAEIIHIRSKIKPGGKKAPKIDNYRSLVERGII